MVLGSIDVVLVTEDTGTQFLSVTIVRSTIAMNIKVSIPRSEKIPDAHSRPRDPWQLDGARETLITLGVIVLETNLQLDSLQEISLLLIERIIEKGLHIRAHSG